MGQPGTSVYYQFQASSSGYGSSVAVNLHHVFSRVTVRGVHPAYQYLIDKSSVFISDVAQIQRMGLKLMEFFPGSGHEYLVYYFRSRLAAYPYDGNPPLPRGR
jgi:hypothetical protein